MPMVRRNGKFEAVNVGRCDRRSFAKRLAEIHKKNGAGAIGFIGSNRTIQRRKLFVAANWRAAHSAQTILIIIAPPITPDCHFSSGTKRAAASATMQQLADASAILLIGNDPDESKSAGRVADALCDSPQCRRHLRHQFAEDEFRCAKRAARRNVGEGGENAAVRWLATGEGSASARTFRVERSAREGN